MNINRAFFDPSPKTVCAPRIHNSQAWHSAAAVRTLDNVGRGGIKADAG
jgi:hypothetical protein